jgi:hypothetical protein
VRSGLVGRQAGGQQTDDRLHGLAEDAGRPAPVRWEAAVELGIEDDHGFDEDEMTGPPLP